MTRFGCGNQQTFERVLDILSDNEWHKAQVLADEMGIDWRYLSYLMHGCIQRETRFDKAVGKTCAFWKLRPKPSY